MRVAGGVFGRLELEIECWTQPERIKVIRRDQAPRYSLSSVANAERGPHNLVRDKRVEQLAVPLKVKEVRPRNTSEAGLVAVTTDAISSGNHDQPVLVGHGGKRTQRNSFNPT